MCLELQAALHELEAFHLGGQCVAQDDIAEVFGNLVMENFINNYKQSLLSLLAVTPR